MRDHPWGLWGDNDTGRGPGEKQRPASRRAGRRVLIQIPCRHLPWRETWVTAQGKFIHSSGKDRLSATVGASSTEPRVRTGVPVVSKGAYSTVGKPKSLRASGRSTSPRHEDGSGMPGKDSNDQSHIRGEHGAREGTSKSKSEPWRI